MPNTLLVCTVGGTAGPIQATLLQHRPHKVLFVASSESKNTISEILDKVGRELGLTCGNTDTLPLSAEQEFERCVAELRNLATPKVDEWLGKGEAFEVVADFTGGTKCMSAALALVARRWKCMFSYVGGTERTKNGVGVVVDGKEQIVNVSNPWNSLGFEAVEQAALLFDHGEMGAARRILEPVRNNAKGERVRQFATLIQLCEAYEHWDQFQHKAADAALKQVQTNAADLGELFPNRKGALTNALQSHRTWLEEVQGQDPMFKLRDLVANAERSAIKNRLDDAVARIYRALEMLAQIRLGALGVLDQNTRKVLLARVPPELRLEWQPRADDGQLQLGLQDDYRLLGALGDDLAERFQELELDDPKKSPLSARNNSILAHGQSPVTKEVWNRLLKAIRDLAGIQDEHLPKPFPRLLTSDAKHD